MLGDGFTKRTLDEILTEIEQKKKELRTDQQKTAFLIELDRKYNLDFCAREGETLIFLEPSDCGRCVRGQKIMGGLFGDYSSLPFVEYKGDRVYHVNLELAKIFMKEGSIGVYIENEKKYLEEKETKRREREKFLIQKFGEDLLKIPGLIEKLSSELERGKGPPRDSCSIVDVEVRPKEGVAAYLLEKHWWNFGSGGIGEASEVKVYRNGQEKSIRRVFRDQYDPSKDDYSNCFHKIEIIEITPTEVKVKAIPNKNYLPKEFTLEFPKGKRINGSIEEILQEPTYEEKLEFLMHCKKSMEQIVELHKQNHPLYEPTTITEFKADYRNKQGAFILFEQIDTDRSTPEGEGWLGDQYRYSIWFIKDKEQPKKIYEDHSYLRKTTNQLTGSRGRDPVIRNLVLTNNTISARDGEGKNLEFKL